MTDILRRAARRLREDWLPGDLVDDTLLAVADWLEGEATRWDQVEAFDRAYGDVPDQAILAARASDARYALAVARAYLGETA